MNQHVSHGLHRGGHMRFLDVCCEADRPEPGQLQSLDGRQLKVGVRDAPKRTTAIDESRPYLSGSDGFNQQIIRETTRRQILMHHGCGHVWWHLAHQKEQRE